MTMLATFKTAALSDAVSRCVAFIPHQDSAPSRRNFTIFPGSEGGVTLAGSDLDRWLQIDLDCDLEPAQGEADWRGTMIPYDPLERLLKALPVDSQCQLKMGPTHTTITSGGSCYKIATNPPDDDPFPLALKDPRIVTAPAKSLAAALARCAPTISREETRYYLNGVFLTAEEIAGRVRLLAVATDGHRLACEPIGPPLDVKPLDAGVIIPHDFVTILACEAECAARREADAMLNLALGDGVIELTTLGQRLRAELIVGPFPNYRKPVPKSPCHAVTVEVPALREALSRASILAQGESRSVCLRAEKGVIIVTPQCTDETEATGHERADAETHSSGFICAFNAGYLDDALATLAPAKRVTIKGKSKHEAHLILAAEDSAPDQDAFYLLMPMHFAHGGGSVE